MVFRSVCDTAGNCIPPAIEGKTGTLFQKLRVLAQAGRYSEIAGDQAGFLVAGVGEFWYAMLFAGSRWNVQEGHFTTT
jgi:hypothetical protein